MKIRHIEMDGRQYVLVPRDQWDAMTAGSRSESSRALRASARQKDGSYTIEHVRLSLAEKVASQRKAAGLTQAQVAKRAGVRAETISRLENGLHMPGVTTFDKIERALKRVKGQRAA